MAINFDNIIIDRVLMMVLEDFDGNFICGANQIQNMTIDTETESKDKTDVRGVLIKRFYTSKSVTLSAENVVFSTSLAALQFGDERVLASDDDPITMPRLITINVDTNGTTYELPEEPVDGTIAVCPCDGSGVPNVADQYESGSAAGEGVFSLSGTTLTLPTDAEGRVVVKYDREVTEDAVKITQYANKFPQACKATFSVLVVDTCDDINVLRQAYIVFPSFQMDPNHSISFTTEDAQAFTAVAQMDYCSPDGEMFTIYMSGDDEYDEYA